MTTTATTIPHLSAADFLRFSAKILDAVERGAAFEFGEFHGNFEHIRVDDPMSTDPRDLIVGLIADDGLLGADLIEMGMPKATYHLSRDTLTITG